MAEKVEITKSRVLEIWQDDFGFYLTLPGGWSCVLSPSLTQAIVEALEVPTGISFTPLTEKGRQELVEALKKVTS